VLGYFVPKGYCKANAPLPPTFFNPTYKSIHHSPSTIHHPPMTIAAEVICVGTELLLGDILNSNSQYLAQELAALGIPHFYQTVVGDNVDRVHQAIEIAAARSSILIFTGGLGPTPDDLTTESIASYFNTPLVEFPDVIADIQHKFAQAGRKMTPSNRKQALQPTGATLLPNPTGTAPGMIWQPREGLTIFTFPGHEKCTGCGGIQPFHF
jgi:nicotinamide-nucleotide amidase